MPHKISVQLEELVGRVKTLETQNKFMRQALRDIRDHDEDESWTYEILQFVASETLRLNEDLAIMEEESGVTEEECLVALKELINTKRF